MNRYEKVSKSLREYFEKNGHPGKGKPGRGQTEEEIAKKKASLKKYWDSVGRKPESHYKAGNKANVYAYRARKRNAIPPDADLKLIKRIYEACPEGYQVDHRIALASGGLHHQDNLQYLPKGENQRKGKSDKWDESLAIQWKDIIPQ